MSRWVPCKRRDFIRRVSTAGMCTVGTSMRHDVSLSTRASRWSLFCPRLPTPSDGASIEGTTRASCPHSHAISATQNASAPVSTITRLFGRCAR